MGAGHDAIEDITATRVGRPVARDQLRVVSHAKVAGRPPLYVHSVGYVLLRREVVAHYHSSGVRNFVKVRVNGRVTTVKLLERFGLLHFETVAEV